MGFNLNTTHHPEYDLNTSITEELINIYGVFIKLLLTEKINYDATVFQDFSHMKTNSESIFEMYALPEESEDFSSDGYSYNPFGITDFDSVVLFVSSKSLEMDPFLVPATEDSQVDGVNDSGMFVDFRKLVSQLIVFPNNKIMEITDCDPCVPGVNNLFTYNDAKSVYKISCKPYSAKLINELKPKDIIAPEFEDFSLEFGVPENQLPDNEPDTDLESADNYLSLDKYFNELVGIKDSQDDEATVTDQVTFVSQNSDENDETSQVPLVNKEEKDIFGNYT